MAAQTPGRLDEASNPMTNPNPLRKRYDALRADLVQNGGVELELDRRTVGVFIVITVLLSLFYYYARPGFFRANFQSDLIEFLGLSESSWRGIFAYWYWALSSAFFRILIPLLCIWFWFKESARDYGFRLWEKGHGLLYAGLFAVMLPIILAMSFTEGFQGKYPFWDGASESVWHFVAYQFSYGMQFVSLEAFFRGFVVFALFKKFGYYAVLIMTIPYCMIHFGKPLPETLGAIIAGVVLGYLALKSKSWIPGALLHWAVGIAMDLACIGQGYFGN